MSAKIGVAFWLSAIKRIQSSVWKMSWSGNAAMRLHHSGVAFTCWNFRIVMEPLLRQALASQLGPWMESKTRSSLPSTVQLRTLRAARIDREPRSRLHHCFKTTAGRRLTGAVRHEQDVFRLEGHIRCFR